MKLRRYIRNHNFVPSGDNFYCSYWCCCSTGFTAHQKLSNLSRLNFSGVTDSCKRELKGAARGKCTDFKNITYANKFANDWVHNQMSKGLIFDLEYQILSWYGADSRNCLRWKWPFQDRASQRILGDFLHKYKTCESFSYPIDVLVAATHLIIP